MKKYAKSLFVGGLFIVAMSISAPTPACDPQHWLWLGAGLLMVWLSRQAYLLADVSEGSSEIEFRRVFNRVSFGMYALTALLAFGLGWNAAFWWFLAANSSCF